MCVVSIVGDHYDEKWNPYRPYVQPWSGLGTNPFNQQHQPPQISREEFEKLKGEVEELKKLLARAKDYDLKNNEPNCEMEEKMEFLKQVAKLVGIDLDDVINGKK